MSWGYYYGYGGGYLANAIYILQDWGIYDVILPFILLFTVIFGIMQKVGIFEKKKADQTVTNEAEARKYNAIISLAITLLVIVPHILGLYPPDQDAIVIINQLLPNFAVIALVVLLSLLLVGVGAHKVPNTVTVLISIGGLIFILGTVISTYTQGYMPYWIEYYILNENVIVPSVALLVLGLVFYYLSSTPTPPQGPSGFKKLMNLADEMMGHSSNDSQSQNRRGTT